MLVAFFALGAIFASFTGVIAERIYTGQSWYSGRSRCDSCATTLSALDLIPILSWVVVRGRCRHCGARVGITHLASEMLLGALFALAYYTLGLTLALIPLLAALLLIAFIVRYDLRHTVIPPTANMLLALAALCYAYLAASQISALGSTLMTAGMIGFAFFLAHALSRGRAMGLGDAPLAFSLALIAGPYALGGLLLSFWIGGAYGIAVLLVRRGGPTMGIEVPFAPFLAAGFLLAYFLAWNPLLF